MLNLEEDVLRLFAEAQSMVRYRRLERAMNWHLWWMDRIRVKNQEWRQRNPEKVREHHRLYRMKHQDTRDRVAYYAAYNAKRRAA